MKYLLVGNDTHRFSFAANTALTTKQTSPLHHIALRKQASKRSPFNPIQSKKGKKTSAETKQQPTFSSDRTYNNMLTSSPVVVILVGLVFLLLLILLLILLLSPANNSSPQPPSGAAPVDYILVCIRLCTLAAVCCLLALCVTSYRYHGNQRRTSTTTTTPAEKWLGRADTLLTLSINLSQLVVFHSGPRLVCVLFLDLVHDMLRLRLRTVSSKLGFLYVLLFCANAAVMHFACQNSSTSSSSSNNSSRTASYSHTCTSSSSTSFAMSLTTSPVDLLHAVIFTSSPSLIALPRVFMSCVWYTSSLPRLLLFFMPFGFPMSTLGPPFVAAYAVYVQAREGYLYDAWLFRAWTPVFVGVHPLAKLVLCATMAAVVAHVVVICNHNVRRYGLRLRMVSGAVGTAVAWVVGMMLVMLCPKRINESEDSCTVQEVRRRKK